MRTAVVLVVASLALAGCSGGDDAEADRTGEGPAGTGDANGTAETDSTGAGNAETDSIGDANGTAETDRTGGAGNESPACGLLTTDEVGELFGEPATVVPADQDVRVAGGSESCLWEASVDEGRSPTIYQLQVSVFTGGAFDPQAWGENPETVGGLGDEAFLVRAGVLGTTAGYRAGDRSVFLSYAIPLGEDAPDSAAQADEVVELLRTVDSRLG